MSRHMQAFLDTIAWAELTPEILATSDNGYNVLVGSLPGMVLTFSSYHRHPKTRIYLNETLSSTAAGRYQIKRKIWEAYRTQLSLKGFYPADQDAIAIQLIKECKAIQDIESGNIEAALHKCRSRWASIAGAGHGQREHSIESLVRVYQEALRNIELATLQAATT